MAVSMYQLGQFFWQPVLGGGDQIAHGTGGLVYPPIGSYNPQASPYTGPDPSIPASAYTVVNGDQTITASNQTFQKLDYRGTVTNKGTANKWINCKFQRSSPAGASTALVMGDGILYDHRGATFDNCLFSGSLLGSGWDQCDGFRGGNVTLRRCEIRDVLDGIGALSESGNLTVLGCWIHDAHWMLSSTQGDGQTHNDGVQWHRGPNGLFQYNFIGGQRGPVGDLASGDDWPTSALLISQVAGSARTTNVKVLDNWLQGSSGTIQILTSDGNTQSGVEVARNRFIRPNRANYPIFIHNSNTSVLHDSVTDPDRNVWDDDGSMVPVHREATG